MSKLPDDELSTADNVHPLFMRYCALLLSLSHPCITSAHIPRSTFHLACLPIIIDSNVVTQSSVPITQPTVTDLAQAQSQLLQLSQFRASAGHSRIPSFGIQQLQGGPGGNQQRKSLFAPYLPAASIPPLLQTGKLVIGVLRVNKRNRSDAYVATDVLDADVFICGSKDRNRALEGDVVAVELLDVDEVWG